MPQVAPYSGAMFAMVARSASGRSCKPGPKYSTNFPTTPCLRSISVIVSTRSVAVAPSRRRPVSFTPTTSGIGFDSTDTPAEHTKPVDHRRVRIRADQCVGIGGALAALVFFMHKHDTGKVF